MLTDDVQGRTAFITGITGQDGSYLAELLLSKGYYVYGMARRTSSPNLWRLKGILDNENFILLPGDITDALCVHRLVAQTRPDEFYNLAAMSFVKTSFDEPAHTMAVVYGGSLNCLEAIRALPEGDRPKFYQASSSEMFGAAWSYRHGNGVAHGHGHFSLSEGGQYQPPFQNECTPFCPNSPYAVAKLAAHNLVRIYRDAYGVFACGGILHNHDGPRRGPEFVTRKITTYVGRLVRGETKERLRLGNLDAKRDWSHAKDMVRGMWLMLQQPSAADYVLATGEAHSVRDFVEAAFSYVGLDWRNHVEIDTALFRPSEVPYLRGDASKARATLGWSPTVAFGDLVAEMVEADLREASHG